VAYLPEEGDAIKAEIMLNPKRRTAETTNKSAPYRRRRRPSKVAANGGEEGEGEYRSAAMKALSE
jgi:hypothetical protein